MTPPHTGTGPERGDGDPTGRFSFGTRVSPAAVAVVLVGLELSPANEALRLAVTAGAAGAGAGAVECALCFALATAAVEGAAVVALSRLLATDRARAATSRIDRRLARHGIARGRRRPGTLIAFSVCLVVGCAVLLLLQPDPGGRRARDRVLVMVGALSVFCFAQALALLVGIAEVSPALIGLGLATAAGVVLVARRSLQRMRASQDAACR
jgi:hypothetical protein